MEFLKKLRSRSLKKAMPLLIFLLVAAVLLLSLSEFWILFQKPVNLHDVPRRELSGKYVTVEIPFIYGSYAYTEEYKNDRPTGNITSQEYIIDANDNDFCGLRLPQGLVAKGNALMQECEDYLNYETDKITKTFTVRGIMKAMPSDSLDFYYETVDFRNMTADQQDQFLPLYLDAWDGLPGRTVVCLILGLALLIWGLVLMICILCGSCQKQLIEKAEALSSDSPEYILSHAEQLFTLAPSQGGLRMNAGLILIEQGWRQYLYSTGELVWAYPSMTQHRVYGIPTGKSYGLVLKMADGTGRTLALSQAQVQEQMQKIQALVPGCALGYSQELATMYAQDREHLAQVAAAQRAVAPKGSPADAPADAPAAPLDVPASAEADAHIGPEAQSPASEPPAAE